MSVVKEKIIQEIESIHDEEMLNNIHRVLQNIYSKKSIIILNDEQKVKIAQAEKDYLEGKFYTTDTLFDEILDG
ncbi:hypothetical protein [Mucilaginibacter arboris]|uniref:Addiction module protein n=1 Tax=Mucilaginibacter arboris TaxID=2682090 RepID=A0A7K1ST21_9SPHI|nr:hypothetical protein [Mucilaginibacter arboris]MVN20250.1 hypothetical protein [Mucilaginibacter arboris]